jgi:anti-sigma factor RsiW
MNPELLDSLLVDRALGELPPAVTALLEAHLALDPAAARRAAEFTATVKLASDAVALPVAPPPPALDLGRLRRSPFTVLAGLRRTELLAFAACLALGLGLGWFARPTPNPVSANLVTLTSPAPSVTAPAEPRSTFWSVSRLTSNQRSTPATGVLQRPVWR